MKRFLIAFILLVIEANAQDAGTFQGQLLLINSHYFITEKYRAVTPTFRVEFAKSVDLKKLCIANRERTACPSYSITFSGTKKNGKSVVLLNTRIADKSF